MERHFWRRSSRRRTGGERRGLLVFLSFSFSFSRLFQEIFITFFRCRSNQLYSFAETRVSFFEIIHFWFDDIWFDSRREKEKRITTTRQKNSIMRQHFPVLYARLSRLLYFVDTPDTYVRFFWEWKTRDHLSTTLAPDTKGREKEKTYIYTRLYTQYTLERTNEPRNPEKKVIITFMRAHDTIIYSTRCISLYSPRAASIILFPMRLSRTIPCNNNNNTVLFTLVRFDTHLHTRC